MSYYDESDYAIASLGDENEADQDMNILNIQRRNKMDKFEMLMKVLQASIDKNGNQNLTVQHLLNMIKIVQDKYENTEETEHENYVDDWMWK